MSTVQAFPALISRFISSLTKSFTLSYLPACFCVIKMGLGLKRPEGVEGAAWPSIMVGMFAAFGGVLYGYDTGTISGIQDMDYWKSEFGNPSADRRSLIVSILSVGTFVGALSAGYVSDYLGRKWGIFVCTAIPFNIGVILQVAATAQPMFIAGR